MVLAVTLYVGVGAVYSAVHLLALRSQEHQLASQIQSVQRQNRVLEKDLSALHNPVTLKSMLQGQQPLPSSHAVSTSLP